MDPELEALIAAQMGGAPQPQPGQGGPPQLPKSPETDTAAEGAATAASPQDEASAMASDPIIYALKGRDGKDRQYTPEQLQGVMDRYRDLNYKHSSMKPAYEFVEQLMQQNGMTDPRQFVEAATALLAKSNEHNPTMGQGATQAHAQEINQSAVRDPFAKWEEDNGIPLPPAVREMAGRQSALEQQLMQTNQMLQQILAGTTGVVDATKQMQGDAQAQRAEAMKRSIGANLDRAQAALQLPDDKAQDFMIFAAERGFTMADFVDPQMTYQVMQDFRNSLMSGEYERLRGVHQKRQSWTGAPVQSARSAGPDPAAPQGDQDLAALVDSAMARRM